MVLNAESIMTVISGRPVKPASLGSYSKDTAINTFDRSATTLSLQPATRKDVSRNAIITTSNTLSTSATTLSLQPATS